MRWGAPSSNEVHHFHLKPPHFHFLASESSRKSKLRQEPTLRQKCANAQGRCRATHHHLHVLNRIIQLLIFTFITPTCISISPPLSFYSPPPTLYRFTWAGPTSSFPFCHHQLRYFPAPKYFSPKHGKAYRNHPPLKYPKAIKAPNLANPAQSCPMPSRSAIAGLEQPQRTRAST